MRTVLAIRSPRTPALSERVPPLHLQGLQLLPSSGERLCGGAINRSRQEKRSVVKKSGWFSARILTASRMNPGFNFVSMLRPSFYMLYIPTTKKRQSSHHKKKIDRLVALLYFSRFALYAVRSSLMKLTPGGNRLKEFLLKKTKLVLNHSALNCLK